MIDVEVINSTDLPLPQYATSWDAGCDAYADLSNIKELKTFGPVQHTEDGKGIVMLPGSRVLIPTGIKVSIPKGYEIQVRPRSGWALKNGISICNSPGTIR